MLFYIFVFESIFDLSTLVLDAAVSLRFDLCDSFEFVLAD
jgi:hypothetical protein